MGRGYTVSDGFELDGIAGVRSRREGVRVLGRFKVWRAALLGCVAFAAAAGVRAQTLGNIAAPSWQATSFETAWNYSVQPLDSSVQPIDASGSNDLFPVEFSPVIKPSMPEAPMAVSTPGYVPISGEERWQNFWNDTMLSPLAYVGALGGAYGGQLSDEPRQWGTGVTGYMKRVGSNLAQFGGQEAIHQGGAALMHTDPRYLNCQCRGAVRRSWYAVKMSFLTYRDNGQTMVDVPELAGAYGGAVISVAPYPSHYEMLEQGFRGGNIQIGANVALNLFKEFSPELNRLNPFRKHTQK